MYKYLAATVLLLASCRMPAREYVEADRATYEALAPQLVLLADEDPENDPSFSGVNGIALESLLESWLLRIEAAERSFDK